MITTLRSRPSYSVWAHSLFPSKPSADFVLGAPAARHFSRRDSSRGPACCSSRSEPLCLAAAKRRIGSFSCTTYCRDALLPISIPEEPFDSIAVSYLLHCLADVPHGCGYGDQHLVGEERCLSQTIPSSLPIFLADSVWSPGRIPAPAISTTAEAIKPFHQLREHHEINNSF
jgi:hypothetical protein